MQVLQWASWPSNLSPLVDLSPPTQPLVSSSFPWKKDHGVFGPERPRCQKLVLAGRERLQLLHNGHLQPFATVSVPGSSPWPPPSR